MEIRANVASINEGPPVVVGFADAPSKPKNYILLSYDPAEENEGLYIEVNDQMRGGYNLVRGIQLLDSSVVIGLTSEGERTLKCSATITVSISPSVQNWQSIKTQLVTLLRRWL